MANVPSVDQSTTVEVDFWMHWKVFDSGSSHESRSKDDYIDIQVRMNCSQPCVQLKVSMCKQ
jgi:hypothetical protein